MIPAKYTEVLKNIIDNTETHSLLIQALSTYPLYEKKSKEEFIPSIVPTREELNNKILNYYKYREIGFETIGRFLDELETAMNEIMPRYNQLFFTADQDYNIIYNVDYVKTAETKRTGENNQDTTTNNSNVVNATENRKGSETTETTSNGSDESTTTVDMAELHKNIKSTTPQNRISVPAEDMDSMQYADEVNWSKGSSNSTTGTEGSTTSTSNQTKDDELDTTREETSTDNGTVKSTGTNSSDESVLETIKGNFGVVSAQDLIAKYRDIILNIEQMILNDPRIQELFMLVY